MACTPVWSDNSVGTTFIKCSTGQPGNSQPQRRRQPGSRNVHHHRNRRNSFRHRSPANQRLHPGTDDNRHHPGPDICRCERLHRSLGTGIRPDGRTHGLHPSMG
jgi:hypothetical protein